MLLRYAQPRKEMCFGGLEKITCAKLMRSVTLCDWQWRRCIMEARCIDYLASLFNSNL